MPCSAKATKLAVENYHYSHAVPAGKRVDLGVWENNKFRGVIIFTRGSSNLYKEYTPEHKGGTIELARVALGKHISPVTQIIKKAIQYIKRTHTYTKLIISYADINQNHLGIIYQAGSWIYLGKSNTKSFMIVHNKKIHTRTLSARYGHNGLKWIKTNIDPYAHYATDKGRFKYAYPLDKKLRRKLLKLQKPYPKQLQ